MPGEKNMLSIAIMFSAVVISGALVFFAIQMGEGKGTEVADIDKQIEKGIETYITKQQEKATKAQQPPPKIIEQDMSDTDAFLGDKDAPVTIVEFSDYQCPYCAKFHINAFKEIKEKYIDTGKVKFVYRDFPLSGHPHAYPSALIAECVGDQKGNEGYFAMHDKLFTTVGAGEAFNYDELSQFAVTTVGANAATLKKCFDDEKFKDEIYADMEEASSVGIKGTPGFIVGTTVLAGAQPFSVFEAAIEEALKK